MTVRASVVRTCDRCIKVFDERQLKPGEEIPSYKQKGLVVIETRGLTTDEERKTDVLFAFEDLCPKCEKAIDGLLDKLRLDGERKKKRKPRTRKAKAEKAPEAAVEAYFEEPAKEPAKAEEPEEPAKEPAKAEEPAKEPAKAKTASKKNGRARKSAKQIEKEEQALEEGFNSKGVEVETQPEAGAAEAAPTKSGGAAEESPSEVSEGEAGSDRADAGTEAGEGSDERELIEDPETGDTYDATTGELVAKRVREDEEKASGAEAPYPF